MQRGNTLVGTLAVVVIVALLAVVLLRGNLGGGPPTSSRADGGGTTIPGAAKLSAQDSVCRSNLSQVRQSITMTYTTDDAYPGSLAETRLGSTFTRCPIGQEQYRYDPASGRVGCPHPGHENY
jgi:hypothetical protein